MKRALSGSTPGWEETVGKMVTRKLTWRIRLFIPSLLFASMRKSAIGFSFEGGRAGKLVGGSILAASLAIGVLLYSVAGILGAVLPLWFLGTTGAVILLNGMKPIAFVRPLCSSCRLVPVIREHEAIHLSGVESDATIWDSMRSRYDCESLRLDGDPSICSFCPIPKRLKEH
jgi:hypothetical protein